MKRKPKTLLFAMLALIPITIGALFSGLNLTKVLSSPANEYTLRFDNTHNYNLQLHSSNLFYRFAALTERGTEIEFLEQNLAENETTDWRQVDYRGGLLNTTKIGGLTDITVNFTPCNDIYEEANVSIKYGWVVGSTSSGYYDNSPLNKYEDYLTSGETFYFSNLNPSYFYMQFEHVYIQSILIHFSCVESIPSVEEQEHYELVKSLSEINTSDIYAISNTKSESGYMMSNAKYRDNYDDDKIRQIVACAPSNEQVEADSRILQLKITKDSDLYYFQAQNYLGTYEDGYFNTVDREKNELYIGLEANKTGFTMSMDADYKITAMSNGSHSKMLAFYSDASSTAFNCYYKPSGKSPIYLYKYVPVPDQTFTLNFSNLSSMSKSYANGNYGKITTNGISYEYYRTVKASTSSTGYAFSMIHPNYYYGDGGYPSSFYNLSTTPIYGIKSIAVTYKSSSGIKVGYSQVIGEENYAILASSSSYVTETVNVSKMHFFKIMTNGSDAYIKDISITYTNRVASIESNTSYSGNRKVITPYSGTPVDGVTKVSMYIDETTTKEYTYYSKQYAYNNYASINKSEAFMLDPVDVSNYYLAFHTFPANYVTKDEKSTYGSKFGSYARQVSTYTRTDGYATAVPYNKQPGQNTPIYYELDIDVNGAYTLNSRQVGRVVVWEYGFSCYADDLPVCVYTDDHYATFQEYNNMGEFASRFNSERSIVNKLYTPLTNI